MMSEGGYAPICRECGTPIFGDQRHDAADCRAQTRIGDLEEALRVAYDRLWEIRHWPESEYDATMRVLRKLGRVLPSRQRWHGLAEVQTLAERVTALEASLMGAGIPLYERTEGAAGPGGAPEPREEAG